MSDLYVEDDGDLVVDDGAYVVDGGGSLGPAQIDVAPQSLALRAGRQLPPAVASIGLALHPLALLVGRRLSLDVTEIDAAMQDLTLAVGQSRRIQCEAAAVAVDVQPTDFHCWNNPPLAGAIGVAGIVALHAPEGVAVALPPGRGVLPLANRSGVLPVVNRGVLPVRNTKGAA